MPTTQEYQAAIKARDSRIQEVLKQLEDLKKSHGQDIGERNQEYNALNKNFQARGTKIAELGKQINQMNKDSEESQGEKVRQSEEELNRARREIGNLKSNVSYYIRRGRISDILHYLLLGVSELPNSNHQFLQLIGTITNVDDQLKKLQQANDVDKVLSNISGVSDEPQKEVDSSDSG